MATAFTTAALNAAITGAVVNMERFKPTNEAESVTRMEVSNILLAASTGETYQGSQHEMDGFIFAMQT